jgi:hypothetical protein
VLIVSLLNPHKLQVQRRPEASHITNGLMYVLQRLQRIMDPTVEKLTVGGSLIPAGTAARGWNTNPIGPLILEPIPADDGSREYDPRT